ncbi:acyltransferase family protein [Anatilimnocola sp. NA78]|uniref:acyltransferase family protein n=1 Tax=Anatilimnocola sp. NA78 TaxID=3415683 RepID=UPI003CE471B9
MSKPLKPPTESAPRLASLDAYRGFIMFLMASAGFGIPVVAKKLPDSWWVAIAPYVDHVPWVGCVLWDLIQPAFMFMVGVAAAYSTANRLKQGSSTTKVLVQAAIRAIALTLLGVMLASNSSDEKQTNWLFTNVLAQIGLGYFFLVLLSRVSFQFQLGALAAILIGYWLLFALSPIYPIPTGADVTWLNESEWLTGFFAHWNPHTNAAAEFDRWFLNLFPRPSEYLVTRGGYQTLNFVPSLGTMLMGLMIGNRLREDSPPKKKLWMLLIVGFGTLAIGWIAGQTICPLVKRIWTPSWTLFSGGWVILILALFYYLIDMRNWRTWSIPLAVIGMNSIFVYLGFQLSSGWIRTTLARHLGPELFTGPYQAMAERTGVLLVLWLLAWWLYRQRVFLRL